MRVLIETTPLARPGGDRGLGRYTRAVLQGATAAGFDVKRIEVRSRSGRTAELRDLVERQIRLARGGYDIFHATNPNSCKDSLLAASSVGRPPTARPTIGEG